jgi:hypothetical protein
MSCGCESVQCCCTAMQRGLNTKKHTLVFFLGPTKPLQSYGVLLKSREMTGRTQTLAWWLGIDDKRERRQKTRGLQRDVVYLGWPIAPSYMSTDAREGGVVGSQPISTAVHRSPNKLWRSNSIFNLWLLAPWVYSLRAEKVSNWNLLYCVLLWNKKKWVNFFGA